ncbi:MAG TPA: S9 family peptidase [Chloroflexota bacterium]|nr:S9 family peptidase [Chloroflexota bacterium]
MTERRPLQPTDLYRLALLSDPQISPDGSRIAVVVRHLNEERDEYDSNIFVADQEGRLRQFTAGGKDSAPRWSPDGRCLAFLSGRTDEAQIHLMPSDGGEARPVTDIKLGAGTPVWSPDSTAIAFAAMVSTRPDDETEKNEKDKEKKEKAPTRIIERASYKLDSAGFLWDRRKHLFVVDVAAEKVQQITDGDQHDNDPAWTPDGKYLVFTSSREPRWDVSTESSIFLIPREGGEARRITGGSLDNPVVSPDGQRVAFLGYLDPEDAYGPIGMWSTTLGGEDLRDEIGDWPGSIGNYVASDVAGSANGIDLTWREDGLYFVGNVRGTSNVFRSENGAVTSVTEGRHAVADFSIAGNGTIALTRSDATHPTELFVLCHGEVRQLTHENEEFLQEVHIATPKRMTFTGACGEESEGWVLAPRGHEEGSHPLLVYIHGGPQTAHGEAFFFEYQFLAGNGIGIFFPNIHGSSSYGHEYETSIRYDWGNLDFQDVMAGTEAAASQPWVDKERVGIAGGSYGGYMTNWAVTHTGRFKAALTERCISNMVSFAGTSDHCWWWRQSWGAFPEEDVQKLWDMSPIKYVNAVTTPLLVMHSERDDRCPVEQGEQMFNALRRLGKDTKFIMFPEECHELTRSGKPSRRVERLGYVLNWFRERL